MLQEKVFTKLRGLLRIDHLKVPCTPSLKKRALITIHGLIFGVNCIAPHFFQQNVKHKAKYTSRGNGIEA